MTTPAHLVGGEVDALCTRCKMELGHTILAMVGTRIARVRCNTCQGEHAYHGASTSTGKKRAPSEKVPKAPGRVAGGDIDQLLEGRDISNAHRYKLIDLFVKGEVVDHPTFGIGVVVDVRGDRFDAVFRAGVKTLAQRKATTTFAKHEHAPVVDTEGDGDAEEPEAPASDQPPQV